MNNRYNLIEYKNRYEVASDAEIALLDRYDVEYTILEHSINWYKANKLRGDYYAKHTTESKSQKRSPRVD